MIDADTGRIVAQRPPQPSFGYELVQRVPRCIGSAMLSHDRDDTFQRVRRGEVAVEHGGELAIRFADSDLEAAVDDPCHLEAAQLAPDVMVFMDDLESDALE